MGAQKLYTSTQDKLLQIHCTPQSLFGLLKFFSAAWKFTIRLSETRHSEGVQRCILATLQVVFMISINVVLCRANASVVHIIRLCTILIYEIRERERERVRMWCNTCLRFVYICVFAIRIRLDSILSSRCFELNAAEKELSLYCLARMCFIGDKGFLGKSIIICILLQATIDSPRYTF